MADPTATTDSDAPTIAPERGSGVYRALAWVGIVAGVVFIVGVVFTAGVLVGGGYPGWHRGGPDGPGPGRAISGCPMMKSGAMGDGPGMQKEMPGGGPGRKGPERVPQAPAPR